MTKKLTLLCLLLFTGIVTFAQEEGTEKGDTTWTFSGLGSVTFTQVALSNWQAGGQSSVSANAFLNGNAVYHKDLVTFESNLDLGYGLTKIGDGDWIKSDDKIDWTNKFGHVATKDWDYSAFLNFKSQFTAGYNYPNDSVEISNFLAPAYVLGGLGMDYHPFEGFSALIAPVTGKMTIVNDQTLADQGAYGVEEAVLDTAGTVVTPGKKTRLELGGYVKIVYKVNLMENITLQTKLDLFSNYLENPQNIDVNWENILNLKVNKYITANLTTHMIYDQDIEIPVDEDGDGVAEKTGPRVQFKEVFGVGFSYKFK